MKIYNLVNFDAWCGITFVLAAVVFFVKRVEEHNVHAIRDVGREDRRQIRRIPAPIQVLSDTLFRYVSSDTICFQIVGFQRRGT